MTLFAASWVWHCEAILLTTILFLLTSDAFDTKLIEVTLKGILEGKTVHIPIYNFKTHTRYMQPAIVCIVN